MTVGRMFMAVRDMDIAAELIGIRLLRTKLLAFATSSFYCGVAGALHEMAVKSGVGIVLDESALPVRSEVRGVSELVGIAALGRNPGEAEGVGEIIARSPGSHRLIRAS